MIWLEYLESINTCFSIEILQQNDSIIINSMPNNSQITIVLDGFIQMLQIFTNGEVICTQLLQANNSIQLHYSKNKSINYYYKATAITKTVILTIPIKEPTQREIPIQKLIRVLKSIDTYYKTNENTISQILCHKNTKKRIVQLLLILSKEFGEIKRQTITIPFYLSHSTLSKITGSNRVNITRIMNDLKNKGLISYNSKELIIYNILQLSQY